MKNDQQALNALTTLSAVRTNGCFVIYRSPHNYTVKLLLENGETLMGAVGPTLIEAVKTLIEIEEKQNEPRNNP